MSGAGERTEQASPRRREDLRRKGSGVGRSRELSLAASVAVGFLVISVTLSDTVDALSRLMTESFDGALRAETGRDLLLSRLGDGLAVAIGIVLPIAIAVAISEIIANLASGGWILSAQSLSPDLSRLNPVTGLGRLFNREAATRLLIAVAKVTLITMVAVFLLAQEAPKLIGLTGDNIGDIAQGAAVSLTSMGIAIVAGLGTIGAIDYAISRRRATGQLKVTKDEARRDVKESEGDPFIRAARRARARQLAFSKMMAAVETADVVVANPTHIAVALRYDPTEMRAPRIVAKGRGFIAERIKKLAREKQVPVIEDRPLARAIVGRPIGAEVPPALYGAVAAILVLVARIRAGRTR